MTWKSRTISLIPGTFLKTRVWARGCVQEHASVHYCQNSHVGLNILNGWRLKIQLHVRTTSVFAAFPQAQFKVLDRSL